MQNRRTERNAFFPIFWKMDSHYPLVDFHKDFSLPKADTIHFQTEGICNIKIDGKAIDDLTGTFIVPAGNHRINVKIYNQATPPTVFMSGRYVKTDASWLATFEDKEWIDETGKSSDVSATNYQPAGYWNFNSTNQIPSHFVLPVIVQRPVSVVKKDNSILLDFGKETFGYVKLHGIAGRGRLQLVYGESKEEALDTEHAETFDWITISSSKKIDTTPQLSKAFRYVNIKNTDGLQLDSVSMLYEYADLKDKGSFACNDEELNKIYDVSKYTLHLSTREFFIDGIKRDRWIWSGDATQSYLMNYYLMNDNETVKRTMYALRGKDPVTSHINTIMDYTFYWFLSFYDYYMFTGDKTFLVNNYDRMKTLMDYVVARRNKDGLLEGMTGDWVFVDWAKGLSKKGALSFEQLLFARGLETMTICADLSDHKDDAVQYSKMATDLKGKLFEYYWSEKQKALVHSRIDGKQSDNITRYANMFAIFFNYFNEIQKSEVKKSVLLNDTIPSITTPYMHFYELEALCALGSQDHVLKEMKDYWGGMLKLGATSFWEEYDPSKKGAEHYEMYGRKFGKSLCHAWGASPIYLLGRYYLGVSPTSPGFETYEIKPALGGLKWMDGVVPTPNGEVRVYCNTSNIKISASEGVGKLIFKSANNPKCKEGKIIAKGGNQYELEIKKDQPYSINYKAVVSE
ncbi:Bacterial alpha-L-rhamnosidase [Rhizosphaericola mali]|uniref:Bacterial alpha-L-rhamnosidase n=2 Tax=Rhizosphaericola mali TaxID=2545455 RepID=A0A5P2GGQ6_9BACT|nr:Bacterial alpha-L-rhamnosidase [Rhizosphaericola mali]